MVGVQFCFFSSGIRMGIGEQLSKLFFISECGWTKAELFCYGHPFN